MKSLKVSPAARADLDGIWDYIAARADPGVASDFLLKFDETFASIKTSPRAGVSVPNLPAGDVRKFPIGNYLIYYRSSPRGITILRVLHGKRLQKPAFLKKPTR